MTSETPPQNPNYDKTFQQRFYDQPTSKLELGQQDIQGLLNVYNSGQMASAEKLAKKLLMEGHDAALLYNILGSSLYFQGKVDEAISGYQQALKIAPNDTLVLNNLGSAFISIGKPEEAAASLRELLILDPSDFRANGNLGLALVNQGKVPEGVVSYHRALLINPYVAREHNHLANALMLLGRLDEALSSYKKSLILHPHAEAYFNLHTLLINSDDMSPAIQCMEFAVKLQPSNCINKFYLGMLLDYSGRSETANIYFKEVKQQSNLCKAHLDAWDHIKSGKKMPRMIGSRIEAYRLGMNAAMNSGLVLEFGVRFGVSICQIANLVSQQVHGFDSFHGLPEAWHHLPKESYTTRGVIPEVPDNVQLHNGWFNDTLPKFVRRYKDPVRFMNIDCDIYSSTMTIFDCLSSQIIPGTVIVFDEYIGNERWFEDEFKAFQEAVSAYGWNYEYLAFSMLTKQVVVRLL